MAKKGNGDGLVQLLGFAALAAGAFVALTAGNGEKNGDGDPVPVAGQLTALPAPTLVLSGDGAGLPVPGAVVAGEIPSLTLLVDGRT